MKHTPGPWKAVEYEKLDEFSIDGQSRQVARTNGYNLPTLEHEANARLIAASPELLKTARAASHAPRSYQYGNSSTELAEEMADALEAAIAKAEAHQ